MSKRWRARVLALGLVVVAAVVVFAFRPTTSPRPSSEGRPTPTTTPTTTASSAAPQVARTPTDEEFCSQFLLLAYSQGQFVSDESLSADLQAAARSLVGTGVPDAMSLPARRGYDTMMSGVYESVGLELSPEEVGAPAQPPEGGDAAFSAYMNTFCPP